MNGETRLETNAGLLPSPPADMRRVLQQRHEGWVLAKIRYDDRGLAHAPRRLHDEVYVDYNDMIYAALPAEIEQ